MIDEKTTIGELAYSFFTQVKKEATAEYLQSAVLENNIIKLTVFHVMSAVSPGDVEIILRYSINGNPYEVKEFANSTEEKFYIKNGLFLTRKVIDALMNNLKKSFVEIL
jgi:hypothetical protein